MKLFLNKLFLQYFFLTSHTLYVGRLPLYFPFFSSFILFPVPFFALHFYSQVHIAQSPSAKCAAKRTGKALDKQADPALTGTTVWDGAIVLSQYLTATGAIKHPPAVLAPARNTVSTAGRDTAMVQSSCQDGIVDGQPSDASGGRSTAHLANAKSLRNCTIEAEVIASGRHAIPERPAVSKIYELGSRQLPPGHGASNKIRADPANSSTARIGGQSSSSSCGHDSSGSTAAGSSPLPVAWPSGRLLPSCIELGAGTGAVSLSLLACQCVGSATITDIPDLLPHLRFNVDRNAAVLNRNKVHVQAVRWGHHEDIQGLQPIKAPFDVIVGSDLIYYTHSSETPHSLLLLQTLRWLSGPRTLIFLSLSLHHNPEEVQHFLDMASTDFDVIIIAAQDLPQEYCVPDVLVVRLTTK